MSCLIYRKLVPLGYAGIDSNVGFWARLEHDTCHHDQPYRHRRLAASWSSTPERPLTGWLDVSGHAMTYSCLVFLLDHARYTSRYVLKEALQSHKGIDSTQDFGMTLLPSARSIEGSENLYQLTNYASLSVSVCRSRPHVKDLFKW